MTMFTQQKNKLITGFRQFRYFSQFVRPYWKKQIFAILLTQITVGLGLINPYITKLVIDDAYKNRDLKLFIILAVIGGVVFLLTSLITQITSYQESYISKSVDFDLNKKTVSLVYDFPLGFFRNTSKGNTFYRLTHDIHSVSSLLVETFFQIFKVVPTFLFTLIIVLFLNWKMALMAFFLGLFSYVHAVFFLKRQRKIMFESIEKNQSIFGRLNEVLSKIYMVKASGQGSKEKQNFLRYLMESFAISLKGLRVQVLSSFSSGLVNKLVIGIITLFGGYQIIKGQMTLGTLTSIMVYLSRVAGFHMQVSSLFHQVGVGMISCERLQGIMGEIERGEESERGNRFLKEPVSSAGLNILFKDVDFYYYPEQFVLKGFNMQFLPRQRIGLVGNSGCGKTTVLNLLLGLYYPVSGKVLIEGVPTEELDLDSVRNNIGVVLQEPYLWNTSIRDNLLYFNGSANDEDIHKVIEEVRISNAIKSQPRGIDTNLGDDACKFSEGQKQRLSLARALLRKPKLLILDEALSFVDNETSGAIVRDITVNYPSMAVLIITHNPLLLNYTEKVFFMQGGKISPINTHQNIPT